MPRRPQHALRLTRRLLGLGYELTPQLFAVLAFAAGALMLTSAVTPELDERLRRLTGVVSPLLIDLSHLVASIAGFLLLLLSAGLWRRRRGAYWAALTVLAVVLGMILISWSQNDPGIGTATDQVAQNLLGRFGAYVASALVMIVGFGAWVLPLVALAQELHGVLRIGRRAEHEPPERVERAAVARVVRLERHQRKEGEAE